MNRKLFFGPWYGEFGWLLCWANPALRKMAEGYDSVVVACTPNTEYLFEFADDFVCAKKVGDSSYWDGIPDGPRPRVPAGFEHVNPERLWQKHGITEARVVQFSPKKEDTDSYKKWRHLAPEVNIEGPEVLVCFRGPKVYRGELIPHKTYDTEKANRIVAELAEQYEVGAIGGSDCQLPDKAVDLRCLPLERTCAHVANAKVVIGISSGGMHLPALCGTPHVVWYHEPRLAYWRYAHYWNPFKVPVGYIKQHDPDPSVVVQMARGYLNGV